MLLFLQLFESFLKRHSKLANGSTLAYRKPENRRVAELIYAYISATNTANQKKELVKWVHQNEENFELFKALSSDKFIISLKTFLREKEPEKSLWAIEAFSTN